MVAERIRSVGDSSATRNGALAVLRGFGVSPMWSPLSISVALTLTLLPGLGSAVYCRQPCPLPFALLVLFAGFFWREPEPTAAPEALADATGWASWLRFGGLIAAMCAGVFVFSQMYDMSYARSVTMSCLSAVVAG
ncbi:hypothetical protein Msub_13091 [Marinobacter subterrani]|uniref:Uncharacterized protein n=1 Tax=Marinobacter subterrani TaxID=1658765 RepID=A0A0J7JFD2_9GAMM|nr:hypothetical protein Msub_13091 [Marinobacter subterrani]